MSDEPKLGPLAALSRERLSKENAELFDWFTVMLTREAMFFSGLLQSVACYYPDISYWEAVRTVKRIASDPDFKKKTEQALAAAERAFKEGLS